MDNVISSTEAFIQERLATDATGHDWHHVFRVRRNALEIAKQEGGDLFVVELTALLHDVADWKFHGGNEHAGTEVSRQWLEQLHVPTRTIDQVCDAVAKLSFKGANVQAETMSIEGQIVQDADRLDAIGAIGIARAFAYGGHKGRPIYDPAILPMLHDSFESYKKNAGPSLNHFYEKLILLYDRFNTKTAKQIALQRHEYLLAFLQQFLLEWHGHSV